MAWYNHGDEIMLSLRTSWLGALLVGCLGLAASAQPAKKAQNRKPAAKKEGRNLVPNGEFERGTDTPTGWQVVDGLTTFWVKDADPKRGKVIKFDTDVYQSQGYEWWSKIVKGAKAKDAPKKIPTKGDKYDTLAGLDGVWFWSDFIPIEKGKAYWLTIDVKGPDSVMAWLVGYEKKESNAFGADAPALQEYLLEKKLGRPRDTKRGHASFIYKYKFRGQLNSRYARPLANGWKRYERDALPFRPTARHTPNVRWVRVLILPTWPPATYYVDNVRLTEIADK
jgi:hypothetical protein